MLVLDKSIKRLTYKNILLNIKNYIFRITNKVLNIYWYTKKLNYIKEEYLLNKRLLIYYFSKKLIFRFNTMSIKKRGILIGKYLLIDIIINIEDQIIIQEFVKLI